LGFELKQDFSFRFKNACLHLDSFYWQEYYRHTRSYSKYLPKSALDQVSIFLNDMVLIMEYQATHSNIIFEDRGDSFIWYGKAPRQEHLLHLINDKSNVSHPLWNLSEIFDDDDGSNLVILNETATKIKDPARSSLPQFCTSKAIHSWREPVERSSSSCGLYTFFFTRIFRKVFIRPQSSSYKRYVR
jgi:hypothetical protein